MYLMRFLGVTLDTYQDTSGYMYPGLFITIHWRFTCGIHPRYIMRYMYLKCIQIEMYLI